MPRVVLNGENYVAQPTPGTWPELLAAIDRDLETRGCVITAIRIDGIDQPGFREQAAIAGLLYGDAIVEVDASTPAALLDDGLREATRSARALEEAAITLAGAYRQVQIANANTQLATFADALSNLMALVAAAGQVLKIDLAAIVVEGAPASDVVRELNGTIEGLLESHAARDWITLADILEHDLAPLLGRLAVVVDALAER